MWFRGRRFFRRMASHILFLLRVEKSLGENCSCESFYGDLGRDRLGFLGDYCVYWRRCDGGRRFFWNHKLHILGWLFWMFWGLHCLIFWRGMLCLLRDWRGNCNNRHRDLLRARPFFVCIFCRFRFLVSSLNFCNRCNRDLLRDALSLRGNLRKFW